MYPCPMKPMSGLRSAIIRALLPFFPERARLQDILFFATALDMEDGRNIYNHIPSKTGGGVPPSLFSARGVPEIVRPPASVSVEVAVLLPSCQLAERVPSVPVLRSIVIAVGTEIPEHQPPHVETAGVASIVVVALPCPHSRRSSSPSADSASRESTRSPRAPVASARC